MLVANVHWIVWVGIAKAVRIVKRPQRGWRLARTVFLLGCVRTVRRLCSMWKASRARAEFTPPASKLPPYSNTSVALSLSLFSSSRRRQTTDAPWEHACVAWMCLPRVCCTENHMGTTQNVGLSRRVCVRVHVCVCVCFCLANECGSRRPTTTYKHTHTYICAYVLGLWAAFFSRECPRRRRRRRVRVLRPRLALPYDVCIVFIHTGAQTRISMKYIQCGSVDTLLLLCTWVFRARWSRGIGIGETKTLAEFRLYIATSKHENVCNNYSCFFVWRVTTRSIFVTVMTAQKVAS